MIDLKAFAEPVAAGIAAHLETYPPEVLARLVKTENLHATCIDVADEIYRSITDGDFRTQFAALLVDAIMRAVGPVGHA